MSSSINVTVKPGVVLLEVTVGPLSVALSIKPRDADALAGAIQRGAIEANAPRLVVAGGTARDNPVANDRG